MYLFISSVTDWRHILCLFCVLVSFVIERIVSIELPEISYSVISI